MINDKLFRFLIGIIIWSTIFLLSNCSNFRLSSLICPNNPNDIPIWSNSDRETPLSEVCPFVVVTSGLRNDESVANGSSSVQLDSYRLRLLLSPSPKYLGQDNIDVYPLTDLHFPDSPNITIDGDLMIDLSPTVTLQPVDLCGFIYLIVVLIKVDLPIALTFGSLSKEIELTCPKETGVDLILQVTYENGSLVDSSIQNRLIIQTNGNSLETLNGVKFIIVNQGKSSLLRRCGLKALQTMAFLLPINRNVKSDFVRIDNRKFFNIANGYHLKNGDKLIRDRSGWCSPFIQVNSSVPVNITWLHLVELTVLPSTFDLLIVIDPFGSTSETKMFTFSMSLPSGNDSFNVTKCSAYPANDSILIINSNDQLPQKVTFYGYQLMDKRLFTLDSTQETIKTSLTTVLVNKYFYQNWFIDQTINLYDLHGQGCSINDQQTSICDSIRLLLTDTASSFYQIQTVASSWEQEQVNKLSLTLKVTSTLIDEVLNGDLRSLLPPCIKMFRSLIVRSFSGADRLDKYDQSYFGTIQRVIENIVESEPPISEAALLVPLRIRRFLGRLIREGSSAVLDTLPDLSKKLFWLINFRRVLLWILEDVLWDFELPTEMVSMLHETISSPNANTFLSNVNKLTDMSNKWSTIETNEEVIKYSTILFNQLMLVTGEDEIWSRYVSIWNLWSTRFLSDSQRWIFLEGLPDDQRKLTGKGNNFSDVNIDESCYRNAIQMLTTRKVLPTWWKEDNLESLREKENSLTSSILFRSDGHSILRGDWEMLTGKIFWTPVILCNCNKTFTNQCSL